MASKSQCSKSLLWKHSLYAKMRIWRMLEQLLLYLFFLSIKDDNFLPKCFGLSLCETITSKTNTLYVHTGNQDGRKDKQLTLVCNWMCTYSIEVKICLLKQEDQDFLLIFYHNFEVMEGFIFLVNWDLRTRLITLLDAVCGNS